MTENDFLQAVIKYRPVLTEEYQQKRIKKQRDMLMEALSHIDAHKDWIPMPELNLPLYTKVDKEYIICWENMLKSFTTN